MNTIRSLSAISVMLSVLVAGASAHAMDTCYWFHSDATVYAGTTYHNLDIFWDSTTNALRTTGSELTGWCESTSGSCTSGYYWWGDSCSGGSGTGGGGGLWTLTIPVTNGSVTCDLPNTIYGYVIQSGPWSGTEAPASFGGVQYGSYGHSLVADSESSGHICQYTCGTPPPSCD
jgi:hypothetical protein